MAGHNKGCKHNMKVRYLNQLIKEESESNGTPVTHKYCLGEDFDIGMFA